MTLAAGRILGVDPGSVRIGIAVSDSRRTMAFPRDVVVAGEGAVRTIADLALEEGVVCVVVGQPLSLDGAAGDAARRAREFAQLLTTTLLPHGIDVICFDERFTTTTASQQLQQAGTTSKAARQRIDSAAATVLLEAYLAATRGVAHDA